MKTPAFSRLKGTILAITLVSASTSICLGANYQWASGLTHPTASFGNTDEWTTAANFRGTATGLPSSVLPSDGEVVFISDFVNGQTVSVMPVIRSDVGQIGQVQIGLATSGQLSLVSGAQLQVTVNAYVGTTGAGNVSTLNLSGDATMVANKLLLGSNDTIGMVSLTDTSTLHAGVLTIAAGDVSSTITLSDNSKFYISGDQTAAGYENTRILASSGSINVSLNANETLTVYTVVPEPSTYALLSGCLVLSAVMIRRHR
ncbi:PEP-CTERM sorting domain-containing protein [Coraliomargarita sp. W4R53]